MGINSGLPDSNRRPFDILSKPLQSNALPTELNPDGDDVSSHIISKFNV